MKQPIKYFSMFSGIGGFEYGMEQSDYEFECVGYSEIDKYARSIYERHYPNHINYGDATKIDTSTLPDFDLLVGGFPCQAFSIAGKRRGFDDTRGTLFFEIARILKDKRPNYFLLENVKGLLSHDKGRTFKTMLGVLADLGYYVQWEIFNSKDYGVPQNRERIYIKGYSRRECGGEILHLRNKDEKPNDAINDNGLIKLNKKSQAQTVYDPKGLGCTLSANGGGDGGKTGLYLVDNPKIEKIGNFITILEKDKKNIDLKDKCIRKLTPIECERLQGFPDNWTKYGKDNEPISDTQRYKCCGNAVTTNVITAIINEMFKEVIEDEDD